MVELPRMNLDSYLLQFVFPGGSARHTCNCLGVFGKGIRGAECSLVAAACGLVPRKLLAAAGGHTGGHDSFLGGSGTQLAGRISGRFVPGKLFAARGRPGGGDSWVGHSSSFLGWGSTTNLHHVGCMIVIKADSVLLRVLVWVVLVVVMVGIVRMYCWVMLGVMVSKEWTVACSMTCWVTTFPMSDNWIIPLSVGDQG